MLMGLIRTVKPSGPPTLIVAGRIQPESPRPYRRHSGGCGCDQYGDGGLPDMDPGSRNTVSAA